MTSDRKFFSAEHDSLLEKGDSNIVEMEKNSGKCSLYLNMLGFLINFIFSRNCMLLRTFGYDQHWLRVLMREEFRPHILLRVLTANYICVENYNSNIMTLIWKVWREERKKCHAKWFIFYELYIQCRKAKHIFNVKIKQGDISCFFQSVCKLNPGIFDEVTHSCIILIAFICCSLQTLLLGKNVLRENVLYWCFLISC